MRSIGKYMQRNLVSDLPGVAELQDEDLVNAWGCRSGPPRRRDVAGPGNGFVDVFDTAGTLLRRFARRGPLNAPWGVAVAPQGFGRASGALLIGNFGDGRINAYDPVSARFLGALGDAHGRRIAIDGLWALEFGNGVIGTSQTLLFTAGPDDETHGLFGEVVSLSRPYAVRVYPRTRYARRDGAAIAYQTHGDGPLDLVFIAGVISHIEHLWEEPALARLFDRQAEFSRLILMDRRGTGLSDPLNGPLPLDEEVDDLAAVLDAVGSERAALHAYSAAAPFAIQFAAKHPERTSALILYAGFARTTRTDDLPWLDTPAERDLRTQRLLDAWGDGAFLDDLAPSAADDERLRDWLARLQRLSASPGGMAALSNTLGHVDVRGLLGELRVPTLVLHRRGDRLIDPRHAQYLADRIPGAKLVWLEGQDSLPTVGDTEAFVGEIEEFLTGGRRDGNERSLMTVLFTDICGGTARAAELGDKRWRDLLTVHDAAVRREIDRFDGRAVKTIGDGFLAAFDGAPSRAVRCAEAIVRATDAVGVTVRCGLHTGECERMGDDIGGMAVHIAARVGARAAPREVLASGTTYGTVVGSGLRWHNRGMQVLKGVPGHWPLFALEREPA